MKGLKAWMRKIKHWCDGDGWQQCHVPTPGERLARWEIEKGKAAAAQRIRAERIDQAFDMMAARKMQTPKGIKLPGSTRARLKMVKK